MTMPNKLQRMAAEILAIDADLQARLNRAGIPNLTVNDYELYTFEQMWGSTALGFGCIGGSQMTSARTYVLVPLVDDQICLVYFAGKFAYAVPYCQALMDDIKAQQMEPTYRAGKYHKSIRENE